MKQRHLASTWTTCVSEGEMREIRIEVLIRSGLPRFDIIGLPQHMIREGKDRILSALGCLGVELPSQKVLVSLNPGSLRKEGSHLDLPILAAILKALGLIPNREDRNFYWGELGLEGLVRPLDAPLNHWLFADSLKANLMTTGRSHENLPHVQRIFSNPLREVQNVKELLVPLDKGLQDLSSQSRPSIDPEIESQWLKESCSAWDRLHGSPEQFDFWAMALLGRHHVLLQGPPGCGKSSWIYALSPMQPPLPQCEWRNQRQTLSVNTLGRRPFVNPHHASSRAAILGGGSGTRLSAGALAEAHDGIIFLDELTEFSRDVLEGLREPMELKRVSIARALSSKTLACNSQVLAAMNACKCGRLGSSKDCTCTPGQHKAYQSKLSGPLRERFHFDLWWRYQKAPPTPETRSLEIKQRLSRALRSPKPTLVSNLLLPEDLSPRQQQLFLETLLTYGRWQGFQQISEAELKNFQTFRRLIEGDTWNEFHQRTA